MLEAGGLGLCAASSPSTVQVKAWGGAGLVPVHKPMWRALRWFSFYLRETVNFTLYLKPQGQGVTDYKNRVISALGRRGLDLQRENLQRMKIKDWVQGKESRPSWLPKRSLRPDKSTENCKECTLPVRTYLEALGNTS